MFVIKYAEEANISSWMTLVREVSWNFPGLETEEKIEEYEQTLQKNIKRKSAICALVDHKVVGILLFSIKHNMLCCMAVHPDFRKKGISTKMIQEMLTKLDPTRDIVLSTFREEDEKGIAPRALYKSFGFVEDALIEEFGYPQQRFILPAKK